MSKTVTLSAYKITWVEVRPQTGRKVTTRDAKRLGVITRRNGYGYMHFANKERALAWLSQPRNLSKAYECRLFTDKQFGMAKEVDGYAIPFTMKQNNDVYYL